MSLKDDLCNLLHGPKLFYTEGQPPEPCTCKHCMVIRRALALVELVDGMPEPKEYWDGKDQTRHYHDPELAQFAIRLKAQCSE